MAVKYVILPDDKTVHLYAESEFTKCGIPVTSDLGDKARAGKVF